VRELLKFTAGIRESSRERRHKIAEWNREKEGTKTEQQTSEDQPTEVKEEVKQEQAAEEAKSQ